MSKLKFKHSDEREVLFYAFRYALNRSTYAVHTMVSCIIDNWNNLNTHDKNKIKKEIRDMFLDRANALMDMDKKEWTKILELQ